MSDVRIRHMIPEDLLQVDRHPAQSVQLGIPAIVDHESAAEIAAQGECWSLVDGDRILACVGIAETFPGQQGVAWGVLGTGIGRHHLAITRHAKARVMASPLVRLEAIARCADAEAILAEHPGLSGPALLEAVMRLPTPETVWARLCGFTPAHVLRRFGAADETHILFERIRTDG